MTTPSAKAKGFYSCAWHAERDCSPSLNILMAAYCYRPCGKGQKYDWVYWSVPSSDRVYTDTLYALSSMLWVLLNMSFADRIEKGRFIPALKDGAFSRPGVRKKWKIFIRAGVWSTARFLSGLRDRAVRRCVYSLQTSPLGQDTSSARKAFSFPSFTSF